MTLFQKKRLSARAAMLLTEAVGLAKTSDRACGTTYRGPLNQVCLRIAITWTQHCASCCALTTGAARICFHMLLARQ